jgi:hypothetical protein
MRLLQGGSSMPGGTLEGPDEAAAIGEAEGGCAFVLDPVAPGAAAGFCKATRRPGSPYCPHHHARCHLPVGSLAERRKLREIEALADAAGGRQGRFARRPSGPLLRRLDRRATVLSRQHCSRNVPEGGDGSAATS